MTRGVRDPPRPPFEGVKDRCNWCGGPIKAPARTWCSRACVDFWWLVSDRGFQLQQLAALHGKECWECGRRRSYPTYDQAVRRHYSWYRMHGPPAPIPVRLEVDHVRALWSLTDEERQQFRWWLPSNLQLLCRECHKAKTKREAGERAAIRRPTPVATEPVASLFDA